MTPIVVPLKNGVDRPRGPSWENTDQKQILDPRRPTMKAFPILVGLLLTALCVAASADAQVTCMQIGKFLTCDGPNGQNSTQMDMGNGRGVISGQSHFDAEPYMQPYTVLPPPSTSRPSSVAPPAFPQMPAFKQPVQPSSPTFLPGLEPLGTYTPYSFGSAPGQ